MFDLYRLDDADLRRLFTQIRQIRPEFILYTCSTGFSSKSVLLDENDFVLLVRNVTELHAKIHGVTVDQYRDWIDAKGCLSCSALTKSGESCQGSVTGGFYLDAKDWVTRQGKSFCPAHGGHTKKGAAQ
ncbi:MAG: hypothetical protein P8Y47_08060 [Alphaproteobacteria bacterium]